MLVSVEDGAEPHLERQFLPSVAIEVEAEWVQGHRHVNEFGAAERLNGRHVDLP
jgi:hypothetical protein